LLSAINENLLRERRTRACAPSRLKVIGYKNPHRRKPAGFQAFPAIKADYGKALGMRVLLFGEFARIGRSTWFLRPSDEALPVNYDPLNSAPDETEFFRKADDLVFHGRSRSRVREFDVS
jgi:hypothetical protein